MDSRHRFRSFKWLSLAGLAATSSGAWAGTIYGTVTYSAAPVETVPLLSDLTVLLLVALVALLGYRGLRSTSIGRPLASVVAVSIALAGGILSGRLESVAQAMSNPTVELTVLTSGENTVDIWYADIDVPIQNMLAKPVKINAVQPDSFYGSHVSVGTPTSTPQCLPGSTVLRPNDICYVLFTYTP